jgi:peptidoglycan/LPS O-acetylase OafA/YrhL
MSDNDHLVTPAPDGAVADEQRTMPLRYHGVDATRVAAVLAVIFIHMPDVDQATHWANLLSRWAVPFFFVAAGYFAAGKNRSIGAETRRVLIRLGIPYAFWVGAYLLFLEPHITGMSTRDVGRLILFGGPAIHLWFVPSLGMCLILLRATRGWPPPLVLALAVGLYCAGLLMGAYIPPGYVSPMNSRNGPFFGFLLVFLGFNYHSVKSLGFGIALTGLVIALAANILEVRWLGNSHVDQLITSPALGFFAFAVALTISNQWMTSVSRFGKYTFGMYIVHLGILTLLLRYLGDRNSETIFLSAIATLILSLLLVLVLWSIKPLRVLVS